MNTAKFISENNLLTSVIELATLRGWLVAHFRPARMNNGKWRTPVQGGGAGFPDLVMTRNNRCLFVELKSERGKLSPEQTKWLNWLTSSNQRGRVFLWRPSDWLSGEIEKRLK